MTEVCHFKDVSLVPVQVVPTRTGTRDMLVCAVTTTCQYICTSGCKNEQQYSSDKYVDWTCV